MELLTPQLAIDQVQLLLRNAKQILRIVKATFSHAYIVSDETELPENIIEQTDAGDGGKLANMWLQAVHKLPQKHITGSDVYQALDALYVVSLCLEIILSWLVG